MLSKSAPLELVKNFESLGDNCEIGVVKKKFNDDTGGLLRWAFSSDFSLLLDALNNRFQGLYQFENLRPWSEQMVLDIKYNIAFHSHIHSVETNNAYIFKDSKEQRIKIYHPEFSKIQSLRDRLINNLETASKIFVYKRNKYSIYQELAIEQDKPPEAFKSLPLTDEEVTQLHHSLTSYNKKNRILVVGIANDKQPGEVWEASPNVFYAAITKLAPYRNAYKSQYEEWLTILEHTLKLAS